MYSISFSILRFLDNFFNKFLKKALFLISNSLRNQLFSFLGMISQLIRLIKFHPLGLKLDARCRKSSVGTLHLLFSSVQFRL